MIKIRLSKNLLYLLGLCISNNIRVLIAFIIDTVLNFTAPYLFLFMMTLGQIMGGLTVYIYQIKTLRKNKEVKYFGIEIIQNKIHEVYSDSKFKKILLIFFAASFDFIGFITTVFYVPKVSNISPSIYLRFSCLSTILSSLICQYALKFKIGKHHKFSLMGLSMCLCLTIIIELLYKSEEVPLNKFIFVIILICCYYITTPFTDCTERYLAYYNFLNPFLIIMTEGIFENQYDQNSVEKFILLIFLLFLYLLASSVLNVYKIYCNVIYTPMARSFMDYFLNPFFYIYYFIWENDFQKNYFYFFTTEIISILMDFFNCVYNEYFILFCFRLNYDTNYEISKRAILSEKSPTFYSINIEDDEYITKIENEEEIESNEFT